MIILEERKEKKRKEKKRKEKKRKEKKNIFNSNYWKMCRALSATSPTGLLGG